MKTTYNNWMMLAMSLLMTTATTTALTACSDDDPVMEEQMPTMLTGGKPMLGDDATKRAFLTDWENCHTVRIAGIENEVNCPWYGATAQDIPADVCFDIKKKNGWEMAFCELNDVNAPSTRMFGLYNRYTGVLRVFHYIEKATGYGDELVYLVAGSESRKDDRYPLYHSMEYGIPACHQLGTTLDNSVKLQSAGATQDAFSCYVAPYTKKGVRGVTVNWHCFDIDLSGYLPQGKDWREGVPQLGQLAIFPITKTTSDITLTGSLLGSIKGSFTDPQITETGGGNSMSGICSTLNTISSLMSGSVSSTNVAYSVMGNAKIPEAMKALTPYLSVGSMGLNITSAMLGWFGGEQAPVTSDTIPGKIDLGLNADINLQGVIAGYTSNDEGGLNLTPELMAASNPYGNLGTGVWGLEEDPVVYISDEDLMAATDHINMNITDKGYTNSEFKDYDVRLVTFYDPSSIKLNLNTDIFHNIRDLVVTTNYGVYTNRQIGNTDSYRRLMKLNSRPTFKINNGRTSGLVRLNRATNPVIHQIDINDLIVDGYELPGDKTTTASNSEEMKELDKCSFTKLPGSDINIYGRQVNMLGQQIVMMPQVFVPYVDGGIISNPVTPDFLVTVNVTFVCDEGAMQFSKTFVPQIKIIKHYELMSHLYRLNEYCQKSANNFPVATLNNNPAVKVYDHHSSLFMKRTIKMLRMMVQ